MGRGTEGKRKREERGEEKKKGKKEANFVKFRFGQIRAFWKSSKITKKIMPRLSYWPLLDTQVPFNPMI